MTKFMPNPAGFAAPDFHVFFDDFDDYAATDWVITTVEAGAGTASEAAQDADGGVLLITNDNGADDYDAFQWAGVDSSSVTETFTYEAGKRLYFEARFKLGDADSSNIVIGLHDTDTDPVGNTISDGIYFEKGEDADLGFAVAASSTASSVTGLATMANDTWTKVAFYYDGSSDHIKLYVDGELVGSAPLTNAPSTELAVSFCIENGAAAAETMSVDYIYVAKERG